MMGSDLMVQKSRADLGKLEKGGCIDHAHIAQAEILLINIHAFIKINKFYYYYCKRATIQTTKNYSTSLDGD